ncbi:hypothetical protein R1flu_008905 [Riccia fluitans]|uniref:Uncharacterized protein n=1 Tax=Riccia fluitans TaxID=41844 RepID=A0ABD1Z0R6_9MARC
MSILISQGRRAVSKRFTVEISNYACLKNYLLELRGNLSMLATCPPDLELEFSEIEVTGITDRLDGGCSDPRREGLRITGKSGTIEYIPMRVFYAVANSGR